MKAITTRYIGPASTLGSRVIALDGDRNRIIIYWDSSVDPLGNHKRAASALCKKMGWHGVLQSGTLLKASTVIGMVWVWVRDSKQITV